MRPQLTPHSGGRPILTLKTDRPAVLQIETSSDLVRWENLGLRVTSDDVLTLGELLENPARFYRITPLY